MTTIPFLFSLLSLLSLLPIFTTSSQSLTTQRSILLSIKQQWGNLPAMSTWIPATSPCSWVGIHCSGKSVTGISLYNFEINSPIPPSICDLKTLKNINLSSNNIPANFPTVFYRCSALTHLDLSENLFVGPIPDDVDKLLPPSIQYLNLNNNNFTGNIPKSIEAFRELKTLYLNDNLFNSTYPSEISKLSKLEELQMANNPFTPMELPIEWGNLKSLRFLFMKECNLVGKIPESFGQLVSLEHLDLAGNVLVGKIPDGLFLLKRLSILYLFSNELSGELPRSIQALNLTSIDLYNNRLSGSIPDDFGKLKRLRFLSLANNNLTGEIPSTIGLLPNLEYLKVFSNELSGPLPPELGLHSSFRTLEIGMNRFSGPLPENLCSRGVLIGITAFSNNLSGKIPKSLENCPTLRTLMIYNNNFNGEIPNGVWTLPDLYNLLFSNNKFTGHLPDRIAENMTRLEISNNNFSGQIPSEIASWRNIKVILADNNMLSGNFPSQLTSLSSLNQLSLYGNRLSGELPLNVNYALPSLSLLNLGKNRFSGPIPAAIGSLPTLNVLDLSSNEFSGEIPDEFEQLKVNILNLSNNKLSGKIPFSFDNAAFARSFLNNTYLCTSDTSRILALPKCRSSSLRSESSKHLSSKQLTLILVISVISVLVIVYFIVFTIKETKRRTRNDELTSWKFTPFYNLGFTEADIISSLYEHHVVGSGGSGKVYRVQVENLGYSVAVKRIWNGKKLDNAQFLAEVKILGNIRHANIVKLLCCISSDKSNLLVYEYMENQSLDRWLHRRKRMEAESRGEPLRVLDWPMRSRIAIGAAQGLSYMHHDCPFPIIHRDVKSSNILLDSEFNAKIADFGLAKMTVKEGELHTMSNVVGTFGYIAPEYRYPKKLNEKIDVFSFGVVLLELATGKEPVNENKDESINLAEWSWKYHYEEKSVVDALDKEIMQEENLEEMATVFRLGLLCTSPLPNLRPSMKDVLQVLRRGGSNGDELRRLKTTESDHVIA